jgi:hypothetical protein
MIEDFEMNVREYWEKKMPLAWETTEDFCIDVLSKDFHVDFEDGSEGGLIKMAKRMSSVYDAAALGDLRWSISTLKYEDEQLDQAGSSSGVGTLAEVEEEEDSEGEEGTSTAADADGWTSVPAKKGKKGKKTSGGPTSVGTAPTEGDGKASDSEEDSD